MLLSSATPLIVTRPEPAAGEWVRELRAHGIAAQALPLIETAPAPDAAALQQARQTLAQQDAVMFVSGQAVQHFLASGVAAAPETAAWVTGEGTAAALQRAGWPAARIVQPAPDAPQRDSEALWAQVESDVQAGRVRRVLIVRGGDVAGRVQGRDWLAARLRACGVQVQEVVAYVRRAPHWGETQRAEAARLTDGGALWLFASSQALAHLQQLLPQQDWSRAAALATHPRIAEAARAAGFRQVHLAPSPSLEAVLALLHNGQVSPDS